MDVVTGMFPNVCPQSLSIFSGQNSGPKKNSLNIKFLGGIFLGHPAPRRRDIPDKNFLQVAFFYCFRPGVAGMSRDLGRDIPDLEKLYVRKLWADFSHPIFRPKNILKVFFFSEIAFQLQPTPQDSYPTTTNPPPKDSISSRFRVANGKRLKIDSETTGKRLEIDSLGGGSVVVGDESRGVGCS